MLKWQSLSQVGVKERINYKRINIQIIGVKQGVFITHCNHLYLRVIGPHQYVTVSYIPNMNVITDYIISGLN